MTENPYRMPEPLLPGIRPIDSDVINWLIYQAQGSGGGGNLEVPVGGIVTSLQPNAYGSPFIPLDGSVVEKSEYPALAELNITTPGQGLNISVSSFVRNGDTPTSIVGVYISVESAGTSIVYTTSTQVVGCFTNDLVNWTYQAVNFVSGRSFYNGDPIVSVFSVFSSKNECLLVNADETEYVDFYLIKSTGITTSTVNKGSGSNPTNYITIFINNKYYVIGFYSNGSTQVVDFYSGNAGSIPVTTTIPSAFTGLVGFQPYNLTGIGVYFDYQIGETQSYGYTTDFTTLTACPSLSLASNGVFPVQEIDEKMIAAGGNFFLYINGQQVNISNEPLPSGEGINGGPFYDGTFLYINGNINGEQFTWFKAQSPFTEWENTNLLNQNNIPDVALYSCTTQFLNFQAGNSSQSFSLINGFYGATNYASINNTIVTTYTTDGPCVGFYNYDSSYIFPIGVQGNLLYTFNTSYELVTAGLLFDPTTQISLPQYTPLANQNNGYNSFPTYGYVRAS